MPELRVPFRVPADTLISRPGMSRVPAQEAEQADFPVRSQFGEHPASASEICPQGCREGAQREGARGT